MTKKIRVGSAAVGLLMLAALVVPAFAADTYTVGEFVQDLAKLKGVDARNAPVAAASLASVGIRIPPGLDYSKRLTEADVARISQAAGLAVRTSSPDAPFTEEQATTFLIGFVGELGPGEEDDPVDTHGDGDPGNEDHGNAQDGGGNPPFDPYAKGKGGSKGKKKGHGVTPTEPE